MKINSLGYFLFDSIDMLKNSPDKRTYELILHHVIVKTEKKLKNLEKQMFNI